MNDAPPDAPRLRDGITISEAGDGGVLFDALFGRRIKLDARALAICRALERGELRETRGPQGREGAHAPHQMSVVDVASAAGTTPDVVATFVGRLVGLDLCATPRALARAAERVALGAVRARPGEHLRVLTGARFACTMCGSCCGGHNVGPVSETILAGLDAALVELAPEVRAARRIDKDLFVTLPGAERATPHVDVMCHASNGSCVFLDDVGKCRIHAKLGGERKPLPCRIFPWEIVATPTGIRVAVQRECRDFLNATSAAQPPLEAAHAELTALAEAIGDLPSAPLTIRVRERELATWAEWEALEAQLSRALEDHDGRDPEALFSALARHVSRGDEPAAPFGQWRDALSARLTQMLRAAPAPDGKAIFRVDAARVLVAALEPARGWVLARALERDASASGEAATLLREHVRHALWSTTPLRASSAEAGLARLLAEWLCARLVALHRAREVKRFHVTTQDLQDGLVLASFLFRHDDLKPILRELDPLTTAVFLDGVELLFARAPDDDAPDRRLELVKF